MTVTSYRDDAAFTAVKRKNWMSLCRNALQKYNGKPNYDAKKEAVKIAKSQRILDFYFDFKLNFFGNTSVDIAHAPHL